jgi:uncharacterized protein (DUF1015 family)
MATIAPFRGILYDQEKIGELSDVVTPPYDVISERRRQAFFDRHPQNVIRLVLSKEEPDDTEQDNRYTRAGAFFRSWLGQGVLKRDTDPALYLTEMDFSNEDEARTRMGFIARVQLEDFDKGGILPHEKTFSGTKADRLRLIQASKGHFCPIFSLFSDPSEDVVGPLRSWMEDLKPDVDFREQIGYRHRLWRVKDQEVCRKVAERLADKSLFIADGHHRYETALNYRNEMVAKTGVFDPAASYNYVLMYLNSMQDPGLVMRSVHRLLCQVPQDAMNGFVDRAGEFFEVREHRALYVLRIKKGVMERVFGEAIPGPLKQLDVTIATKLVLQKILGFDETVLDDEDSIKYTSRSTKAFEAVDTGKCDMALILNPTRLSHMEAVSRAGLIMPRKSTYFFPKVLSGLVMNKVDD